MATLIEHLRNHLAAQNIVRAPDVAGPGGRPWLPPAWKHPDTGAVGPGDAKDAQRPATTWDDGLVVSLMIAPGITPAAGNEERRIDGVDIVLRGNAVPAIIALEKQIRGELLGAQPGGRTDWVMAGLYVVQSRQWRPFAAISTEPAIFTFSVGYIFEILA